MRTSFLTAMLLFTAFTGFSQDKPTEAPKNKQNGYYGRVTAGVLTGDYSSMSFQFSNGFRFGQTEVGIGLGYEGYYGSRFAPLFFESRYYFLRNRNTQPFIGISAGYLASLNQSYYYGDRNGYTGGANIGLTHFFTPHFGISSSVGYRYLFTEQIQSVYLMDFAPTTLQREMHRLEMRIGIVFR
jgi:hypothetical protein